MPNHSEVGTVIEDPRPTPVEPAPGSPSEPRAETHSIRPVRELSPTRQLKRAILRLTVVLAFLFTARYFYWRVVDTGNPAARWFFVIFLVAEALNFVEAALFYLTTWSPTRYATPVPLAGRSVDVYITTYNESLELLRETVVCALSMSYPHQTYLLDDGDRAAVREMAQELGCGYIARQERTHAKAGNLNNALRQTAGEFIVTLDADHIPAPNLIEEVIGFFRDPRVGAVQTAQDFYNLDSFQHHINWRKRSGWQQQELFFNVIQPGKDRFNATFFCGSPSMLRRSALEQVGGFATESITEDMHTGLRLQKAQWRLLYHNRSLAFGLAPQTFLGFATQWQRWGYGCMQVLRRENPLFARGLGLGQRLCYFSSVYFYWMSYQKLLYALTPIVCLLTGVFPLLTDPRTFVSYFFPYFFLNLLASVLLQGGFTSYLRSEQFNLLKMHVLIRSTVGLFRREGKFQVTPKSRAQAAGWDEMLLPLFLMFLLVAGLIVGTVRAWSSSDRFAMWALAVNLLWALFYLFMLAGVVARAMRRKELRSSYRFPAPLELPVTIEHAGGRVITYARNLNRSGVSVTLDEPLPVGTLVKLELEIQGERHRAQGEVVRQHPYQTQGGLRHSSGIRFTTIAAAVQDEITKYLLWQIAPRHSQNLQLTYNTQHEDSQCV